MLSADKCITPQGPKEVLDLEDEKMSGYVVAFMTLLRKIVYEKDILKSVFLRNFLSSQRRYANYW